MDSTLSTIRERLFKKLYVDFKKSNEKDEKL